MQKGGLNSIRNGMEWISVEDRLPEDGQRVEFKYEVICKGTYYPCCIFNKWIADYDPPIPGVIAWRPLDEQ